jgi:serine/threonine protein kinase
LQSPPGIEQGLSLAGRFRLIRPLGLGANGETWLAEDAERSGPVALKFLSADTGSSRDELAGRLNHPHIAAVYGRHCDGGRTFIAMQYVGGQSVGTLRGAGFRGILRGLLGVADALDYAHGLGIVHRDLKPSNVICDSGGHCWLTDFGAAADLGADEDRARGAGSLPAMSPQQLSGDPPAVSDDVYGFGSLVYDLLAGHPLFHPQVTAARIRRETPALPAGDLRGEALPARLTALLSSLLKKSPLERPPGMAAVRSALEEILQNDPAVVIRCEEPI